MSFFRRHPTLDTEVHDDTLHPNNDVDGDGDVIDPALRIRTVRTAASVLAESIRTENRRERWRRKHGWSLRRKGTAKTGRSFLRPWGHEDDTQDPRDLPTSETGVVKAAKTTRPRRNIYLNVPLSPSELDDKGEPNIRYPRNKVRTSSRLPILSYNNCSMKSHDGLGRIYANFFLS